MKRLFLFFLVSISVCISSLAQKKELAGVEKTLSNPGFVAKAAPEVIAAKQERKAALAESIAVLEAQISELG